MFNTNNTRIQKLEALVPPEVLLEELPITEEISNSVNRARLQLAEILAHRDDRLIVVVGPCSIHDEKAALEYAQRLKTQIDLYRDTLMIIMRVYFEKPRTTIGWKGLINDPYLNDSYDINYGLRVGRRVLLNINALGVPTGSEFLDTVIPQYISDLSSWSAIGARTTESQIHRELASGLSMPVGFKNGQSGDVKVAVDAVYAAKHPHHFLGVTKEGVAAIVSTTGNETGHIILRGAHDHTNYDAQSIAEAVKALSEQHLPLNVMIDCSHGNSNKDHNQQPKVAMNLAEQIGAGNPDIIGVMLESHLVAGKQNLSKDKPLVYGQSITDACIGWEDTMTVLKQLSTAVIQRRSGK